MALFVVLLGPPGAGKGTQAKRLAQSLALPHISSGDLFRDHLNRKTELGLMAKEYMDRGDLVPDSVTVGMVIDKLSQPVCEDGAILDGFPRTLSQAIALDEALEERGERVDVAPLVQISDDEVIKRLTARRSCRDCGAVYNLLFNPPEVEGVCDACGGPLYQRDDDNPDTIRNRLYTYYKETSPLIGYYCAKGVLREIDGERSIDDIQRDLESTIKTIER